MAAQPPISKQIPAVAQSRDIWLRKHADYQRVYREGKRQSFPLMACFFAPRAETRDIHPQQTIASSRVGLTAGRVLGNAVERNRIKRRMRAAVRLHHAELAAGMDLVLHPRRSVLEAEFSQIERDVLRAFRVARSMPPQAKGCKEQAPYVE